MGKIFDSFYKQSLILKSFILFSALSFTLNSKNKIQKIVRLNEIAVSLSQVSAPLSKQHAEDILSQVIKRTDDLLMMGGSV